MFENISTIRELLDLTAKEFGEKPLFSYWKKEKLHSVSYSEFSKNVTAVAKSIVLKGITESKIAVVSENSYQLIVWIFAVTLSGNVLVILDNNETIKEKAYRVLHSETSCLIYSDYNKPFYDYVKANIPGITHTISIESETQESIDCLSTIKLKETDGTALAYITYTSGTTGKAKGVMHSQINVLRTNFYLSNKINMEGSTLFTLPLSSIYGFPIIIFASMYKGAHIFISAGLKTVLKEMKEVEPDFMFTVPAVIAFFNEIIDLKAGEIMERGEQNQLNARKEALSLVLGQNLKVFVTGSAALNLDVANRMQELGVQVLNGLGMTETGSGSIINIREDNRLGSIGSVVADAEVKIIEGEVALKSQYIFMGYYKDPEATAETFHGDWFLTGDLGYIKDDYVYLTGRKKNLIILSNGKNISPEELESELLKIEEIIEALVYEQDGKITAKVYSKHDEETIRRKINEMNKALSFQKQIQQIVIVKEEFPKTGTQKIKRGEN